MNQSLIIISDKHYNNNKRLICSDCNNDIEIASNVIGVRVKNNSCSLRFRYHVDCWHKLNKEANK